MQKIVYFESIPSERHLNLALELHITHLSPTQSHLHNFVRRNLALIASQARYSQVQL